MPSRLPSGCPPLRSPKRALARFWGFRQLHLPGGSTMGGGGSSSGGAASPRGALSRRFSPPSQLQIEGALDDGNGEGWVEMEDMEQEEGPARAGGKAARRSGRAGSRRRAAPITGAAISDLLAAAPALVDLLIEEDSVRCITLVARDAVNLSLAAGGAVDLAPLWAALAARIR